MTALRIYGIRHHGPGSARSVLEALQAWRPDVVLVEGPPEADALVAAVADADLVPPVALLIYAPDAPQRSVFYPFAAYSPEWQALRWAQCHGVPIRFFDLPATHQLALEGAPAEAPCTSADADADADSDAAGAASAPVPEPPARRRDPWARLAEIAGVSDAEELWERWVEERIDRQPGGAPELAQHPAGVPEPSAVGESLFAAVADLMAELRQESGTDPRDLRREAWMRRALREELKSGRERIAVVCGAWHAPVLEQAAWPTAKSDQELLKALPKLKVEATWVPWSNARLCLDSGYGAGVRSPGWFAHLWQRGAAEPAYWITRAVQTLRERGVDCGPAHAIEATRLALALAQLRGREYPALPEMDAALLSVACGGDVLPLCIIDRELNVGDALGRVPAHLPQPPLCADLARQQKRLRLPPEAGERLLELDLRKDNDRARSELLFQLRLLDVHWGRHPQTHASTGTFRESWRLKWDPELVLPLIDAARHGNTVDSAAAHATLARARELSALPELAGLLESALKAGLSAIQPELARRLDQLAAGSADVVELLLAFNRLAPVTRYGDVRGTDFSALRHTLDHYFERICIGLKPAACNLNEEAAERLLAPLVEADQLLRRIDADLHWTPAWQRALAVLRDDPVHPLIAGRCVRLLLDRQQIDNAEAQRRLGLALSPAVAARQAAWLEGFLGDSGLLLLHLPELLALIDQWICGLAPEVFNELLPLLRRAFAQFQQSERRAIGEQLGAQGSHAALSAATATDEAATGPSLDLERGALIVPTLRALWGLPPWTDG